MAKRAAEFQDRRGAADRAIALMDVWRQLETRYIAIRPAETVGGERAILASVSGHQCGLTVSEARVLCKILEETITRWPDDSKIDDWAGLLAAVRDGIAFAESGQNDTEKTESKMP